MGSIPPLLTLLMAVESGWVHRRQLRVIELIQAEYGLLKDGRRGKRVQFNDAQRALLARKDEAVGRKDSSDFDTIMSLARKY